MSGLRCLAFGLAVLFVNIQSPAHASAIRPQKHEVFLQLGHTGLVQAIAVSPDGKLLASGDFSGLVKLWEASSGREIGSFLPEGMPILTLAWSPDGRFLYAGTADGRVLWLDAARMEKSYERSCVVAGKIRELHALAVDPRLPRLACANSDGNVTVIDVQNGKSLATLDAAGQGVNVLRYAADGSRLFGGGRSKVWHWTMDDGMRAGEIDMPDAVSNIALFPDGERIAVSFGIFLYARETSIRIFELTSGRETMVLSGAKGGTFSLAMSHDGKRLYSGMVLRTNLTPKSFSDLLIADYRVHVWNLDSGALIRTLEGHTGNVTGLSLSPDGQTLYSSSWDRDVRAWSLAKGSSSIYSGRGLEPAAVFADGLSWGAIDKRGRMMRWDSDTGAIQHIGEPALTGLGPFQLNAAVMSARGPVALIHDKQGELAVMSSDKQARLSIDVIKPDLHKWASSEIAAKLGLPESKDVYRVVPVLSKAVLSSDGMYAFVAVRYVLADKLLAAWSRVAIWNVTERKLSGFVPGIVEGDITALSPSSESNTLLLATEVSLNSDVSGPKRHSVEAVRVTDGYVSWRRQIATPRTIEVIATSRDGQTAVIGRDFVAEVVDVNTGATRHELAGHSKLISALAYAPDGKSIVTGSHDGAIRFWETRTGKLLHSATGHADSVRSMAFLESRGWLISTGDDRTVRIWRSTDATEVVTLAAFRDRDWAALTVEGFFSASPGGAQQVGFRVGSKLYQLDQFYDLFYRPDLIRRKLGGETIASLTPTTVARALASPPPDIRLELPSRIGKEKEIPLEILVASTGGGIGDIRVFHNGKLVRSDGFLRPVSMEKGGLRSFTPKAMTRRISEAVEEAKREPAKRKDKGLHFEETIRIRPVAGANEIAVAAFNGENSIQSRFVTRRFVSAVEPSPPRLFVISIGINEFLAGKTVALKYAAKDARDIADFVKGNAKKFELGKHGNTYLLLDTNASKKKILDAFAAVAKRAEPQDSLLIFVATHGVLSADSYNFITHDFRGELGPASAFSAGELLEALKHIGAQRQIVVLDTCHAGGMNQAIEGLYDARMTLLARNAGLHVLASSGSMEEALDGFGGNGLFTHVFLNGLKSGDADTDSDQKISVSEIGGYSRTRVESIAREVGHDQTPLVLRYGKDYPVLRTK